MSSKPLSLTQSKPSVILSEIVKWVMILCSVISTGCMIYSVILRYVFKGNFYGSDEVIMLFAFWLYFLGAVYGSYENSHIKADLLNVYIHNMRKKDAMALLALLLTIVVNTILVVWGFNFFMGEVAKGGLSTGLKIPLVIPKSAVFIGLVLMEIYHILYFIENLVNYLRLGYFSVPQDGDYVSEAVKAKYNCECPTKEEAKRIQAERNAAARAEEESHTHHEKKEGDKE